MAAVMKKCECGAEPRVYFSANAEKYFCECHECGANSRADTEEEAVAKWEAGERRAAVIRKVDTRESRFRENLQAFKKNHQYKEPFCELTERQQILLFSILDLMRRAEKTERVPLTVQSVASIYPSAKTKAGLRKMFLADLSEVRAWCLLNVITKFAGEDEKFYFTLSERGRELYKYARGMDDE